jgi:hypothetical protein
LQSLKGLPSAPTPRAPVKKLQHLKKDPRKQVRDTAIRNYVCRSYNQKQFALPPNTKKEDLDAACKGVK